MDENNKIYLTDCPLNIRKEEQFGTYLSLFAVGEPVENLTLEGVYYPLDGYRLTGLDPLCVSNEIVEKECNISFSKGVLLVIESKD